MKNDKNEFLIAQRAENKSHSLRKRIKEELEIDINKERAKLIGSTSRYYKGCLDILAVWMFEANTFSKM